MVALVQNPLQVVAPEVENPQLVVEEPLSELVSNVAISVFDAIKWPLAIAGVVGFVSLLAGAHYYTVLTACGVYVKPSVADGATAIVLLFWSIIMLGVSLSLSR
jgi:hypothetical protein